MKQEQPTHLMPANKKNAFQRLYGLHDFGVLVAAIVIAVFFSIASPAFLTPYNLFNLFRQMSELGIIAMAMTILIISGEFDLSVGAIYAVTGVVTGLLFKKAGIDIWFAAMLAILLALMLGFINGLLITKTRMHSFIGTLATMMVFRGAAMVLSQGQPISAFPQKIFFEIAGRAKLFGAVPIPILWLLVWGGIMYIVLHHTAFGVKVFATGDNREAADLAGIKTVHIKRLSFLITALAAGVSGIISLGYLKTVTPTQGTGIELEAIAASVIGGTAMSGGVGSIIGTFLGALIMAEVRTGLILLGTDAYVQDAFVGLIIAVAVVINVRLSHRKT
ncbi:ribose ABC transporter, permease protein, RbsC [Candidatus Vecturithrix granuli]|uniref:Ribose ABC transporter, permease protein, RbsC n=1 Tax=Vecturithrix granuli TaxID=1499967 RepID=A0A0S6WAV9_VECG1|nr:ribose ABC transporter, permease protein, RbsC [Candidatus Vecturithrix granuli]